MTKIKNKIKNLYQDSLNYLMLFKNSMADEDLFDEEDEDDEEDDDFDFIGD